MYMKDKQTRITLRLTDKQFDFVKSNAEIMGVSPSEFLRIVISATMSTQKIKIENINEEVLGRENDKTDFNNKL